MRGTYIHDIHEIHYLKQKIFASYSKSFIVKRSQEKILKVFKAQEI